ncbi:uncharacterized protein TNCT_350801 [Trichonephila clavata]|uniref:Uncharacterized protein n=1 Tax=Trichonephila clavata TaxID=2740835 RepID=A0A8X6FYA4_TRICU|nr:uncharacterized protein TNCT_350801 [Trichonephila clavata]
MDPLSKSPERSSMTDSSNPVFELEKNFNLNSLIETLEMESALLKRAIRKNFESLRLKMSTTGEIFSKNLDSTTRGALGSIRSGSMIARNEFLFESVYRKCEETSLEIGERAKKVASNNCEGILKKISIHNNRVKQKFTPKRFSCFDLRNHMYYNILDPTMARTERCGTTGQLEEILA